MIHALRQIALVLSFAFIAVGCPRPEEMNIGKLVPTMKFVIEFQEAKLPSEIYQIGLALAEEKRFSKPLPGQHDRLKGINTRTGREYIVWNKASAKRRDYKLTIAWDNDGSGRIKYIWVVLSNDSTDRYTLSDWEEFATWESDVIPRTFPNDRVKITSHPARFTSQDKRQLFSQQSGVELPERYQKN